MSIVSFNDYEVTARFDGTAWTQAEIQESATQNGPWNTIDTIDLPAEPNPADPQPKSFTTENATLDEGWYLVTFLDDAGNRLKTDPVQNGAPDAFQILASLDDINSNLDGTVVQANAENTALIQVSVNRIVKGYLARVIDPADMVTWTTPVNTPDIIREIAGKLIAAQLYANETAKSTTEITPNHYSQHLYNQVINTDPKNGAPGLLDQVISGDLPLPPPIPSTPLESMSDQDYFPIDDTDRAFTMGMNL